jgi:hypothetical protein
MPSRKKDNGHPLTEPEKMVRIRFCKELKGDKPDLRKKASNIIIQCIVLNIVAVSRNNSFRFKHLFTQT